MDKLRKAPNKIKNTLLLAIFFVVSVGGTFIGSLVFWMMRTWGELTMDEILFHLQAPIKGASSDMIWRAALMCGIPTIIILIFGILTIRKMSGKYRKKMMWRLMFFGVFVASCMLAVAFNRYRAAEYLAESQKESDFIKENYVEPKNVSLKFPKKKRNLVYIFLESMENTNASIAEGGQFEKSLIPELAALANENVNFSSNDKLGGGIPAKGSVWTIGAMFAQTSGLPLKSLENKSFQDEQAVFFPDVTALGDILHKQKYNQVLMVGSDSTFGGRKAYFTEHGPYEIYDYYTAKENERIPSDYKEFWGFEDQKLFTYAKEKVTELSQEKAPFNLTLLTVDTHFEDGYICELCTDEFGDDQYANAIACSSRQVAAFVTWLQEQPFYEDTTIVLAGDHLSMDKDFYVEVPYPEERQVYNAFINSAVEPSMEKNRKFATMDFFPTTLASMGVKIEGEKLALGTNLFSEEETLIEKYGKEGVNEGIAGKSSFFDKLGEDIMMAGRLKKEGDDFKYEKVDGTWAEDEWILILNKLHHFNKDGILDVYKDMDLEVKTLIPGGELRQDGKGWKYKNDDGSFAQDETKIADNVRYYFDKDGYLTEIEMIDE